MFEGIYSASTVFFLFHRMFTITIVPVKTKNMANYP